MKAYRGLGVKIQNTKASVWPSPHRVTDQWTVAFDCSNLATEKKKTRSLSVSGLGPSVEIRNIKELSPLSRGQATVHWTVASNYSNLSTYKEITGSSRRNFPLFGPSVEIRTRGLLNPIQARYQTSPHPDLLAALGDSLILAHLAEKCKHYFSFF